ncbi:hypothetical protein [Singulisphaera sp. PoT]|uniref:hypothetical protein n=1 Tax=Singulisphaera sp. PoT TaxID=3411797 RepID=UPI003BF6070A
MRLAWVILVASLAFATGCTSVRLRQRTINQAATLPELQFQQVLDNLAQFAVNPSTLPYHVNLKDGTSQVTDSVSGGALVDIGPPASTQPQIFGSRTVVAQWGMEPVIDATELRLLRIAYRRAHGSPEMPDPEFLNDLAHDIKDQLASNSDMRDETNVFYQYHAQSSGNSRDFDSKIVTTNDDQFFAAPYPDRSPLAKNVSRKIESIQRDLAKIQPGWFHVGRKKDVPKDACYVGQSGACYVWVNADGREALSEFTLTVLGFSALIKEPQTPSSPGTVKFSPGDRGG